MVWGSGGERALKEQGNRENGTNLTVAFLRQLYQNKNGGWGEGGIKKTKTSFLRNKEEELALI